MDGPERAKDAVEAGRAVVRARFGREIARPEPEIGLARAALLVAAYERPDLDEAASLERLDALAERVRVHGDETDPPHRVLTTLHDVLYREAGFRGPAPTEAGGPDHSRLDRVLERRVGLPISLAVVELEVADRVGLTLWGVGLPGHFIIGGPDGLLLDPADGGRRLMPDDCQALVRRALGERVLFHSGMIRPLGARGIVARVLRNLRAAHLARRDWPAALLALDLLAIVEPTDPGHVRDRGLLLGRLGRFSEGIESLRRYLDEEPDGADAGDVRQVIGIFVGRRN
jgi:regulator of sirC expression with transglutaminase-like and TPR domain